jgi:hypothetical protein
MEAATRLGDDVSGDERGDSDRDGSLSEPVTDIQADRLLVERCLAGEVAAWDALYGQYRALLCAWIRWLLGSRPCDPNVVDEIAARVWYSLIENDGRLLGRFDPRRHVRLCSYFRGLARIHTLLYFRDEHRRHARENQFGRERQRSIAVSELSDDVLLSDFADTLTVDQRGFLEEYLVSSGHEGADADDREHADTRVRQRRHRIMVALRAFFANP